MKRYVNIIIEISATSLDRPFTYLVPEKWMDSIEIGCIVTIPFGNGNRMMKGYVIGFLSAINFDEKKLKSIIGINETVSIESELIKLAVWMQKRYLCTLQGALKVMIPSSQDQNKKYTKIIERLFSEEQILTLMENLGPRSEKKRGVLAVLKQTTSISQEALLEMTEGTPALLKGLEEKGVLAIHQEEAFRDPFKLHKINRTEKIMPNSEQQIAIERINHAVSMEQADIFLLHGITGSGKTEVYLQAIDHVLKLGRQAIVLIPEIALTPQTVSRFIGRFGDIVGVLHSKLSKGEKYDQWRKAKEGKISIMIGPRSAIFAPFEKLGIIILDEEHEMTYKSEMPPKFHAREVAIKRGSMAKCPVVLGSATPLIESYQKALEGKYQLLELNKKAIESANLSVEIVDMRQELISGNKSMLSMALKKSIEEALANKEQIILFLNRRGHSSFVSCRNCGYVVKCPSCDIPYTYHSDREKLLCHYCGKVKPKVTICPQCQSKYIKEFGIGTQKVENFIKSEFSSAKVIRMDFDTTTHKNSHEVLLEQFLHHEADILIGTQMIAKGHHFENVTVVGVLAADMSLFVNDFRACERTFQLITQVTGRTGRGLKKGKAVIQTYTPEHYSLQCSRDQDYKQFFKNEIAFREMMQYPPFTNLAIILMSSKNEKSLIEASYEIKAIILEQIGENNMVILGPTPANQSKIKDVYRWRMILKGQEYRSLNQLIHQFNDWVYTENRWSEIAIQIDMNPMMAY